MPNRALPPQQATSAKPKIQNGGTNHEHDLRSQGPAEIRPDDPLRHPAAAGHHGGDARRSGHYQRRDRQHAQPGRGTLRRRRRHARLPALYEIPQPGLPWQLVCLPRQHGCSLRRRRFHDARLCRPYSRRGVCRLCVCHHCGGREGRGRQVARPPHAGRRHRPDGFHHRPFAGGQRRLRPRQGQRGERRGRGQSLLRSSPFCAALWPCS